MNEARAHSTGESVAAASGWLVGGGLITLALFPLAIPIIALTAIAVLPFLLVPLAGALAIAVLAVPILLVRRLVRSVKRGPRPRGTAEPDHRESRSASALPPARAGWS
jgi:membrane protein implicated in regulation of membrane protease activity